MNSSPWKVKFIVYTTELSLLLLSLLLLSFHASGAEYIRDERVTERSALQTATTVEAEFDELQNERAKLFSTSPKMTEFFGDSKISFNARAVQFERSDFERQEGNFFTGGGHLKIQSGLLENRFSTGLTYSFSHNIASGADELTVGTLQPNGDSIGVLSEAFIRLDATAIDISAIVYRQSFNLPYLNRQDSRMIPNTFEAYRLDYQRDDLDFMVAYVGKMKGQAEERFTSMSSQAGSLKDHGVFTAGFRSNLSSIHIGAINYFNKDTMNIFYGDTNLRGSLNETASYQLRTQITHQKSIGAENIGHFDTWHWGASVILSWRDMVLRTNYTITDDNDKIRSPWGGRPHFNSFMLSDFDRANEESIGFKASYSFDHHRWQGLSLSLNWAQGWNAQDKEGRELTDVRETNLTFDYKPTKTALTGLWLRARFARVETEDDDRHDVRLILNYPIELR